jgi:glycosyltransferase involved in cell wall biosynthesis
MAAVVPVSVILPTRNRAAMMTRVLESLHAQTAWPAEIVICDASDDESTGTVVQSAMEKWQGTAVVWRYDKARRTGLAPQRNQAVQAATQPYVWFLDDDVILEPGCLQQLHQAVAADEGVGGATATITNQGYQPPGKWAALLMRWFEHGRVRQSYAAACVGPCCTFMPDTAPDIAPLMPAEWLIGCCSLYRKSALPVPAVPDHFEGGAFGEDLAASLTVRRTHRLVHVRDARCYHDSQGGEHKSSLRRTARLGVGNRHYIMTHILGKDTLRDHLDFALLHLFYLAALLVRRPGKGRFLPVLSGYAQGFGGLLFRTAAT